MKRIFVGEGFPPFCNLSPNGLNITEVVGDDFDKPDHIDVPFSFLLE